MKKLSKSLLSLLIVLCFLFSLPNPIQALTLDSIGTSSTTGSTFSEWWYTGQNPTLTGTAIAGSSVSIDIDGTPESVTADSTGAWTYNPTQLTTGDHSLTITGDDQTMAFTLHIGQSVPSSTISTPSAETLPQTGSLTQTFTLLMVGIGVIFLGYKLRPALEKTTS